MEHSKIKSKNWVESGSGASLYSTPGYSKCGPGTTGVPNDLLSQLRGAGHVQRGVVARRSLIPARH